MTPFNLNDSCEVLAGTLYGETRGCGRAAMENVAQVILQRVADKWDTGGIIGVCLAPLQFSCWNHNDPNRAKILAAPSLKGPELGVWITCSLVADAALRGHNPNRTKDADCYFARSMAEAPYWAKAPAEPTFADTAHVFWRTRLGPHAPNHSAVSVRPAAPPSPEDQDAEIDALNLAQLDK